MVSIHNTVWLGKLGQEGGGGVGILEMEGGDLPLGQIVGSWTVSVQGKGDAKRLPSPSHLLKLSPKTKKQKDSDPSVKQEA